MADASKIVRPDGSIGSEDIVHSSVDGVVEQQNEVLVDEFGNVTKQVVDVTVPNGDIFVKATIDIMYDGGSNKYDVTQDTDKMSVLNLDRRQ